MNEKNELNNIILDRNENNKMNAKKFSLIIACLVLIGIIVILLMSTFNEQKVQNDKIVPLPPKPKIVKEDKELFEDVKTIENQAEETVKKLKEESLKEIKTKEDTNTIKDLQFKEKITIDESIKEKTLIEKEKPKKVKKTNKNLISKKFYIQVGSFSIFNPNSKFLKSINANGFSYKLHKTKINKKQIIKVIIGPFDSKKEAIKNIKKVRGKIEKKAFITYL